MLYKSKTEFHLGDLWYTKVKILTLLIHQSNYWKWYINSSNCIIRCILTFLPFSWCLRCNLSDVKVQLQCFLPNPCTWISLVIHHVAYASKSALPLKLLHCVLAHKIFPGDEPCNMSVPLSKHTTSNQIDTALAITFCLENN